MTVVNNSMQFTELLSKVRGLENVEVEPLSKKDCTEITRQLQSSLRDELLPRALLDFVQPQLDGLRRKIAKLPTTSGGLREGQVRALAKGLAQWAGPLFKAIDARLAALEARPMLEDAGVWSERTAYQPGHVVTHDGSAWVCRAAHLNVRPPNECWRLLVKRGRDAKVDIRSIEQRLEAIERRLNL